MGMQNVIMGVIVAIEQKVPGGSINQTEAVSPFSLDYFFAAFVGGIGFDIGGALIEAATVLNVTCVPQTEMTAFGTNVTVDETLSQPNPFIRITTCSLGNFATLTSSFLGLSEGSLVFGVDVSGFINAVRICFIFVFF